MDEAERLAKSTKTKLNVEICKLPREVREMPLQRFQQEFGEDVQAAGKASLKANIQKMGGGRGTRSQTRGSVAGAPITNNHAMQTPASSKVNPAALQTPMSTARAPKSGEVILSSNGSPLGEYR